MGIWERTFFTRTAFAYFYSDFINKNIKKWFEKGENFTETSCRSMEAVSTMKLPLKKAGELHNTTTLQILCLYFSFAHTIELRAIVIPRSKELSQFLFIYAYYILII